MRRFSWPRRDPQTLALLAMCTRVLRQISHGTAFLSRRKFVLELVLEEFDLGEKLLFDVFGHQ